METFYLYPFQRCLYRVFTKNPDKNLLPRLFLNVLLWDFCKILINRLYFSVFLCFWSICIGHLQKAFINILYWVLFCWCFHNFFEKLLFIFGNFTKALWTLFTLYLFSRIFHRNIIINTRTVFRFNVIDFNVRMWNQLPILLK